MDTSKQSTEQLMKINSMLCQGLASSLSIGCNWLDEYACWRDDEITFLMQY